MSTSLSRKVGGHFQHEVGQRAILPRIHFDLRHPTRTQVRYMRLIAGGMKNRDVANELGKSIQTVKNQNSALYARLGATGRVDAINKLKELGFITL